MKEALAFWKQDCVFTYDGVDCLPSWKTGPASICEGDGHAQQGTSPLVIGHLLGLQTSVSQPQQCWCLGPYHYVCGTVLGWLAASLASLLTRCQQHPLIMTIKMSPNISKCSGVSGHKITSDENHAGILDFYSYHFWPRAQALPQNYWCTYTASALLSSSSGLQTT